MSVSEILAQNLVLLCCVYVPWILSSVHGAARFRFCNRMIAWQRDLLYWARERSTPAYRHAEHAKTMTQKQQKQRFQCEFRRNFFIKKNKNYAGKREEGGFKRRSSSWSDRKNEIKSCKMERRAEWRRRRRRASVSSEFLAAQQRASSPTKQWLSPYSHAREWKVTTVAYVDLINENVWEKGFFLLTTPKVSPPLFFN